jgi:hypothetical protein
VDTEKEETVVFKEVLILVNKEHHKKLGID